MADPDVPAPQVQLYVGQVPLHITSEQLAPVFGEFGQVWPVRPSKHRTVFCTPTPSDVPGAQVESVHVITDRHTQQSKGCAFVTYANADDAQAAIEALNNKRQLSPDSRPIVVKLAEAIRPNERKLFVSSIPRTATEDDIAAVFRAHGEVVHISLHPYASGERAQYAFVRYATREEAKAAIASLNGAITLPGADRPLLVKFANSPKPRRRDGDALGVPEYSGPGPSGPSVGGGPSLPPHGWVPEPYSNAGHKLFVGMVPFSSTEADLEAVFAPYGSLMEVFLMREKDGKSKGCAFVRYHSRQSAVMACAALNGTMALPGCARTLVVKYADTEARGARAAARDEPAPQGYFAMPTGAVRMHGEQGGWISLPTGAMMTPMVMGGHPMMHSAGMMPMGMGTVMGGQQYVHARSSGMVHPSMATYQYAPSEMHHVGVHPEQGHGYGYAPAVAHHYTVYSPAAAVTSPPSSPAWMGPMHADSSAVPAMESLEARLSSASLSADVAGGARGWGNLYVSNLPPHVQDHDVHQLFAPYGSVLDMQVMRRPDGSAKGNVFISFRHPHEGQAAAAALNGIIIGGSPTPLSVRPSNRKSITSSRRSSTGSERRGASPVSMHAGPFGHVRGADAKQSGFAYPGGPVAPSG